MFVLDFSQQQPSLDTKFTRRHSLDSQISFHMSEHERMTYMAHAREQRRKKKKGVRRRGRNARVVPNLGLASLQRQRRGSDTSQHSDFGHLIPHHLLATEKINNIKKEAIDANQKKVSQRRTGFFRPLPSLKLPEVFSHKPKNTLDLFQKIGNYNRGFSVGQDTSQQRSFKHVALPMMEVALPGQIGIEEGNRDDPNSVSEHSLALNQPSTSFGRRGPSAGKIWEDDSKSNISTDNESLHKLGEELSSKILIRAIRDSQSDLENANLVCSSATTGLQLHNLRQKTEEGLSNLNNCFISGRSTVVDMFMDNDNRDSSSS